MKTFFEYLSEENITKEEITLLEESLQSEWTDELEQKVDAALEEFTRQYANEDGTFYFETFIC